mgnify:CR=1 FL=1
MTRSRLTTSCSLCRVQLLPNVGVDQACNGDSKFDARLSSRAPVQQLVGPPLALKPHYCEAVPEFPHIFPSTARKYLTVLGSTIIEIIRPTTTTMTSNIG